MRRHFTRLRSRGFLSRFECLCLVRILFVNWGIICQNHHKKPYIHNNISTTLVWAEYLPRLPYFLQRRGRNEVETINRLRCYPMQVRCDHRWSLPRSYHYSQYFYHLLVSRTLNWSLTTYTCTVYNCMVFHILTTKHW